MNLFNKRFRIKEAFDNLPIGLCYFDRNGIPILCNKVMYKLVFDLSGQNLQHEAELITVLNNSQKKLYGIGEKGIISTTDDRVWRFKSKEIKDSNGLIYIEYTAFDVTELYIKKIELEKNNIRLSKMADNQEKLFDNIRIEIREEEILEAKSRVHDRMGRSLIVVKNYLDGKINEGDITSVLSEWNDAILMLQGTDNKNMTEDFFEELKNISSGMIQIIYTRKQPVNKEKSYIFASAVRECVTNAIRHAKATELYVRFLEEDGFESVEITNNGLIPLEKIKEGGGLSSLRKKIEKAGGIMEIESNPLFKLRVTLPIGKE